MRKIKLFGIILALCVASSCQKSGCTDSKALNYSDSNTKDDGSCIMPSDVQNEIETDAKVFNTTLYFNAGDTYQSYNTVSQYYDNGDIILTFVEDPNESNLTGFWVQMPFLSDDNVNFYSEVTSTGEVFVNTATVSGGSPWSSTHYFNFKFVLIKGTGLIKHPDVDLTNFEEVKEVFNL